MTVEEIIGKSIPPIIIGIVFAIATLFTQSNTNENRLDEYNRDLEELKKDAEKTHMKQWQIITDLKVKVVQLEERSISKDTYYKDKTR